MSDGSFREIQLTSKQVVFLFMAGLVAAVGIFLLGVLVGQRVGAEAAPADATETADTGDAPVTMPPATTPRPGELTAPNELQDRPVPTGTVIPTPTPTAPPSAQASSTSTASTPTPTPPPAKAETTKPTPTPTPKPAAGTHYVQAGSFASRDNALRRIAELKKLGQTGELIVGPASDRARYRVRIGPMAERDARNLQTQLGKAGIQSLVAPR